MSESKRNHKNFVIVKQKKDETTPENEVVRYKQTMSQAIYNKKILQKHEQCICYYCLNICKPSQVRWDCQDTAWCKRCQIDSVVPYDKTLDMSYYKGLNIHAFGTDTTQGDFGSDED